MAKGSGKYGSMMEHGKMKGMEHSALVSAIKRKKKKKSKKTKGSFVPFVRDTDGDSN